MSGTISLMLEANANLGYRDVQQILAASAHYTLAKPATATDYFVTNKATNWNLGGYAFSAAYGFGVIDAYAAVKMAKTWFTGGLIAQTASNLTVLSASGTAATAQSGEMARYQFTVGTDLSIEHALVKLNLSSSDVTKLKISLIDPSGTVSLLGDGVFTAKGVSSIFGLDIELGSKRFMGESSKGVWTLVISSPPPPRVRPR